MNTQMLYFDQLCRQYLLQHQMQLWQLQLEQCQQASPLASQQDLVKMLSHQQQHKNRKDLPTSISNLQPTEVTTKLSNTPQESTHQTPIKQSLVSAQLSLLNQGSLRSQIEDQLTSLILGNEQTSQTKLDEPLETAFTIIRSKYISQRKSKEQIIKFIMRKAFKFLIKQLQKKSDETLTIMDAQNLCLSHYFEGMSTLPFRKNSKIKTMNFTFLEQVFSSEKFVNDYKIFLVSMDDVLRKDNQRKFTNTCNNILRHIQTDKMHKLKTIRRMPWTDQDLLEVKRTSELLLHLYGRTQRKLNFNKFQ